MTRLILFAKQAKTILTHVFFQADTARAEVSLGVLAFNWGVWLLLPPATFGTGVSFQAMAQIAPEAVWGIAFGLLGLLKMHYGTSYPRSGAPGWRKRYRISLIGSAFWAFLASMFAVANFWSTATVTYTTIAAISMSIAVSIGRRVADGNAL